MTPSLRVALFTDSFEETNGVATLSREYVGFARRRGLPFFCVQGGRKTSSSITGEAGDITLGRGWASFPLDHGLDCDPLLCRHKAWVTRKLAAFAPHLVHITGPGDVGVLGFWVAHSLGVPLVASWHTNLHEYAGLRIDEWLCYTPSWWRRRVAGAAESLSLEALTRFYRLARFVLSPNEASAAMLERRTGRPAFLMEHGVDTGLFSPARRAPGDGVFRIGYVGRLTPEKSVRCFAAIEQNMLAAGASNFRFVLVGDGSERNWLRSHVRFSETPGILRGEALADAYASFDAFVFPSRTDTFGLVLLEAMASGVPVLALPAPARRVSIRDGVNGFQAESPEQFAHGLLALMNNSELRRRMRSASRDEACRRGWDGVFDRLYHTYAAGLEMLDSPILDASPVLGGVPD